jgi:hypothetical protein
MTLKTLPTGFNPPKKANNNRLICSVSGMDKTGKTHFALGAPAPIAFFNLNIGLEGVIQKFDSQIGVFDLEMPEELGSHSLEKKSDKDKVVIDMKNQAINEIHKFEGAWVAALKSPDVRTIVIDTNTELWGLYRIAEFGKTNQIPGHLYNYLNSKYKRRLSDVFKTDKNLILTHSMREIYEGKEATGEWTPDRQKNIPGLVQVNLIAERCKEKSKASIPGQPNPPFKIIVENSRVNPDLLNSEFEGVMCTFPMVAAMVMGTSPDAWI